MHIKLNRADLLKAMTQVCGIVERNPTTPILSHCLISVSGSKVSFFSTDLDHSVTSTIAGEVFDEGAAVIPALTLFEIVKKLPDDELIEMVLKGNEVSIKAGKANFNLQSLSNDDFPPMASPHRVNRFELSAGQLLKLIDATRFAMSTDETRYTLNGAYLHTALNSFGKKCLRMVATDAHRLSVSEVTKPDNESFDNFAGVILSRKTISELRRILDSEPNETVTITVDKSLTSFQVASVTIVARIVEGNFPDYVSAIPEGRDIFFTLKRQNFIDVASRVSVVANDKIKLVRLDLTSGCLKISAGNEGVGSASDEISLDYDGNPWYAGVNVRYLLDVAGQIESDDMRFYIQESVNSILILDPADNSNLFVVMPMRV